MSTTTIGAEVRRYLDAVRAYLSDLPESDRDELLQDLEEHLLEVEAEDDGTLEQRLGPPDAYAEELRSSVGLPSREDLTAGGFIERVLRSHPVRSVTALIESSRGRAVRKFIRELGPGWWVLRGYLGVLLAGMIFTQRSGISVRESIPFPRIGGSYWGGVLLIPIAVWISVQLGRRAARDRRAWLLSLAVTGTVLAVGFTVLGDLGTGYYSYEPTGIVEEERFLQHEDGTGIANICPYASDGKLLSGVLLFDSRGRAITNTVDYGGAPTNPTQPAIKNVYPRAVAMDEVAPGTYGPVSCPPSITAQPQHSTPAAPAPEASKVP